ncbi:MAG: patatin-like phospholipase family protein [Acidobacteriota bacterium]|nr:patatin-like phospholipase family protein [Acidobacteriota bacterium]
MDRLALLLDAKRVGYVFSGGSSRCAFQIGVIEALAELGVKPSLAIGVSAGAWNAALVAARAEGRIRYYWRSFMRMPHIDLRNLLVDHSPWRFRHLHGRNFDRFIGRNRFRQPDALPLLVSVTRFRDGANVIFDARDVDDPLQLLLATNYLLPFYTHRPRIGGEAYGDGGLSDNAPYEKALDLGCDAVVVVSQKGESEGGLFKKKDDYEHVVSDSRVVVIRPRHRLPFSFTERRWHVLDVLARIGYLRTRELLLGEEHAETHVRAEGEAPSARARRFLRAIIRHSV